MTMEWNNRNDWFNPNDGNGRESFEEHNENMREFRGSHADVALVNGPRPGETTLLERMESLQVSRTMTETGGSALPDDTTDWLTLVPMWRVARYKLSQN